MPAVQPPEDGADLGSARHRACGAARAALSRTGDVARRLEEHIAEDNEQLGEIRRDVGELRSESRELSSHVGDLRVDVAKTLSAVDNLTVAVGEQREIKHVKMIAEVETGKAATIAIIEDEADQRRTRRAIWLKVGVAVLTLLSGIVGALIEHFR
jgi:hypothetical protein